jgi:hypothetical protein
MDHEAVDELFASLEEAGVDDESPLLSALL